MADLTPPPPSSGTILMRIDTPNTGKTFGRYINRFRKAAILLGHDDAWLTPQIRLIAKGIRSAHDKRSAFPNSIMTSDAMRIIHDPRWQSAVVMVSYRPYRFAPRTPSEALQLTIANPNGKLLKFGPHGPKSLIGHRTYHDATAMGSKFCFQENVWGGCILARPRL